MLHKILVGEGFFPFMAGLLVAFLIGGIGVYNIYDTNEAEAMPTMKSACDCTHLKGPKAWYCVCGYKSRCMITNTGRVSCHPR